MALELVLIADRRLEGFFLFLAPAPALGLDAVAAHGGQHARRLFAAHHADARIRPHPQEARAVGAAAHAVVAGAEGAADQHGDLGHLHGGDRGHHLRAVLGDAAVLVLAADHEAGDVLQEQQRNAALAAQLDEVRALLRRLAEQDAVVGDDAHRVAVELGEAAHQRRAVARLELVEARAIDHAGDDLAHVEGLAGVAGDDAVDLFRVVQRLLALAERHVDRLRAVEVGDDAARDVERVGVVLGQVVGDAREPGVNIAAAQVLGAHHLAGGRLHQRRAAEEDRALVLDDDGLVRHRRHVGAAGGARTHHHRDLRDALGRHVGLVVEDAAEVVAVGEDLVLPGQEGAARVDQVDAGQVVLLGDLLRAQVLLDRHRVVGAALHRGVVGHDHAFDALHAADAGDDAGARRLVVVHAVRRHLADLEEGRARIEQVPDAVTRQQLAARGVLGARRLAAAEADLRGLGAQILDLGAQAGRVGLEVFAAGVDAGFDHAHRRRSAQRVSENSSRPISMRRISLVPAPISYSLASRHRRPTEYSLV